jgi:hypothetical protein
MSGVATAIAGAAIVGGVVSAYSAKSASDAAGKGASQAAGAELEATRMQIAEIQRQYDYQQKVLLPQIQQQYNAQRAYSDLLGIKGPDTTYFDPNGGSGAIGPPPGSPGGMNGPLPASGGAPAVDPREAEIQARMKELNATLIRGGSGGAGTQERMRQAQAELNALTGELQQLQATRKANTPGAEARMGPAGSSGMSSRVGPNGFVDPNLDPTKLADTSTYQATVRGNLLAGTTPEADPYRNYINSNRIAAPNAADSTMVRHTGADTMMGRRGWDSLEARRAGDSLSLARGGDRIANGAAGIGVYGDTFQASPGYAWTKEEMQREIDRKNSAGGNYGGRALMEAERRASGIANTEYYNWAAGRTSDLQRRGAAEAADIGRLDTFAGTDIARRDSFAGTDVGRLDTFSGTDLSRGDTAYQGWENQRIADVGRGDEAYQNYLARRGGDVTRLDSAAQAQDRLTAADLARKDQGYYNYLQNVKDMAGFGGGPAATAINASERAGSSVANAYGAEGSTLANIYGDLGTSNANLKYAEGANINNALVSGASNYATYKASLTPKVAPVTR